MVDIRGRLGGAREQGLGRGSKGRVACGGARCLPWRANRCMGRWVFGQACGMGEWLSSDWAFCPHIAHTSPRTLRPFCQEVNPQLMKAMVEACRSRADRSSMVAYFTGTTAPPKQVEFVGIAKFLLNLKTGCDKQLSVALDCLRSLGTPGATVPQTVAVTWGPELVSESPPCKS